MFIAALCGAAAWTADVNIDRSREGLGGRSPPKKNLIFIPFVCGAAAWRFNVNIVPRRAVGANRVSPRSRPREGVGGTGPRAGAGETGSPRPFATWRGARLAPSFDVMQREGDGLQ